MPKSNKTVRAVHYIFDTSGGIVNDRLMAAKNDDHEEIFEHPEMRCFDLRGHMVDLSVLEVPEALMPKILRKRENGEFHFRYFIGNGTTAPAEVLLEEPPVKKGKKKTSALALAEQRLKDLQSRKRRRQLAAVH